MRERLLLPVWRKEDSQPHRVCKPRFQLLYLLFEPNTTIHTTCYLVCTSGELRGLGLAQMMMSHSSTQQPKHGWSENAHDQAVYIVRALTGGAGASMRIAAFLHATLSLSFGRSGVARLPAKRTASQGPGQRAALQCLTGSLSVRVGLHDKEHHSRGDSEST